MTKKIIRDRFYHIMIEKVSRFGGALPVFDCYVMPAQLGDDTMDDVLDFVQSICNQYEADLFQSGIKIWPTVEEGKFLSDNPVVDGGVYNPARQSDLRKALEEHIRGRIDSLLANDGKTGETTVLL